MNFSIYTSYFYQIRNFIPNMIPVSTALSDPVWYRPPQGKEYYIDKRGVVNGLRYEPIIVQGSCGGCPCDRKDPASCSFLASYRAELDKIDFDKMLKGFQFCLNKFNANAIALIVHEAPTNPCSERKMLQQYFQSHGIQCTEWKKY